jgi:hypothetical protein
MQPFLEAYLEIENTPRNHRTRSHLLAQLLARFPNMGQIAFEDLLLLLEHLEQSQVKIRMPLFAQVIYPVLQREIESGNLQAMSVLLQYPRIAQRDAILKRTRRVVPLVTLSDAGGYSRDNFCSAVDGGDTPGIPGSAWQHNEWWRSDQAGGSGRCVYSLPGG